ncbi:Type IV fimbrial biogenesis protein FimT [Pseudoalteromonas sp. JB197]|nr:Type IV fimbrial biogenesis protein FimT [Pseudoalteromonas sp. JB197]
MRVMQAVPKNDKVEYSDKVNSLRFNTSGRITTSSGSFIYCPNADSENNKALNVSATARSL